MPFTRNCPKCGHPVEYNNKVAFERAKKVDSICVGCAARGRRPWNKSSPETEQQIKSLNDAGLSTPEICRFLSKSEGTVSGILSRLGCNPNPVNHRLEIVDDFNARCSQCLSLAPIASFTNGSKCPECTRQVNLRRINGERLVFLQDRLNTMKKRSEKKGWECIITAEHLLDQLEKQDGKCVYTGFEMRTIYGQGRSPLSLSVDRVDPRFGYIIGNVVLCTLRANTIKSDMNPTEFQEWLPSWYNRLQESLRKWDAIKPAS